MKKKEIFSLEKPVLSIYSIVNLIRMENNENNKIVIFYYNIFLNFCVEIYWQYLWKSVREENIIILILSEEDSLFNQLESY